MSELKLNWDDKVPEELLDKWVGNMEQIQALSCVTFQQTVIPDDASTLKSSCWCTPTPARISS